MNGVKTRLKLQYPVSYKVKLTIKCITPTFLFFFQYLEKKGIKNLQREHFSFSTKVFIGDFLKPTGRCLEHGDEKYVRLSEKEMFDDIDKLRRENGWKPRRRGSKSTLSGNSGNTTAPVTTSAVNTAADRVIDRGMSGTSSILAAAAAANAAANAVGSRYGFT